MDIIIVPSRYTVTSPNDASTFTEMTALSLKIEATRLRISVSVVGLVFILLVGNWLSRVGDVRKLGIA
jgi:hypothetical protein